MIIWNSGGEVMNLGAMDRRRCDTCEATQPFSIVLQYRYWALYWIFSLVTEKRFLLVCDVCHRGSEIEAAAIEQLLAADPIPFMRRFGVLVLAGVVVVLMLMGSLGDATP